MLSPPADDADARQFVSTLRQHGGTTASLGNQTLRSLLGWDEERYGQARDRLAATGQLTRGRGRGGSVRLIDAGRTGEPSSIAATASAVPVGTGDLESPAFTRPPSSQTANRKDPKDTTAHLGFEAKLWLAADKLRNNMDAAEYKHVVLGLIFLKYISDAFEDHHAKLLAGEGEYAGADPEDADEYKAENIFWVPQEARWSFLQAPAKSGLEDPATKKKKDIGILVDDAMEALERDNPRLKGALTKNYGRADLDKHRLGELIDLIGSIDLGGARPPSPPAPLPEGEGGAKRRVRVPQAWISTPSAPNSMAASSPTSTPPPLFSSPIPSKPHRLALFLKVGKSNASTHIFTADRGLSYKGEGLRGDRSGLPICGINSIYEGGGYKHEGIKYCKGEYREKHLVEPGDMIVTNTEQGFDHLLMGHAAIFPRCFSSKGLFSHHIYRVRFKPSSPFNPHYLVELFNNSRWHYW